MFIEYGTVFITLAIMFGLLMTWGIGANDVANAMGTSVGSGAISIKQAIIIAAIFEFAGAFLAGGHVTKTIRKGIIDPTPILGNPEVLKSSKFFILKLFSSFVIFFILSI